MKTKKILTFFLIITMAAAFVSFDFAKATKNEEIEQINNEIKQKQKKLKELKKQSEAYLNNITEKQKETASLQNQLAILENKIAKTEIDIQSTEQEIEKTKLEIKDVELQITNREKDILKKDDELAELIRLVHQSDQKGALEILIANNSLSEFFDQIKHTKSLQSDLQNSLMSLKSFKTELEGKKETLNKKTEELQKLKLRAEQQKIALKEEMDSKTYLLEETQNSEEKFYNLYWQTKQEQQNASSEIYNLEREARQRLEELEKKQEKNNSNDYIPLTDSALIWPVKDISGGISAYFHDPTYPYRYLFEHPGIDIRSYQGTPLYSAADGYVIKAKDNGYGYSYIAIMHANGISTVYGHVSHIGVKTDQYVRKGQLIGKTGGMPGTLGAGNLSTGPHLHLEVRLNGIPVNPLNYLPN